MEFDLEACDGGFGEEFGEPSVRMFVGCWAVDVRGRWLVLVLGVGGEMLEGCGAGFEACVAEVF